jgi:hypothetical protein
LQYLTEESFSVSALGLAQRGRLRLRPVVKFAAVRPCGPIDKRIFEPLDVSLVEAVVRGSKDNSSIPKFLVLEVRLYAVTNYISLANVNCRKIIGSIFISAEDVKTCT